MTTNTDNTAARLAAIKEQVAQAMSTSWLDDDDSYRIANEVPWLIAYVEQLQRERDELRKVVESLPKTHGADDSAHESSDFQVTRLSKFNQTDAENRTLQAAVESFASMPTWKQEYLRQYFGGSNDRRET